MNTIGSNDSCTNKNDSEKQQYCYCISNNRVMKTCACNNKKAVTIKTSFLISLLISMTMIIVRRTMCVEGVVFVVAALSTTTAQGYSDTVVGTFKTSDGTKSSPSSTTAPLYSTRTTSQSDNTVAGVGSGSGSSTRAGASDTDSARYHHNSLNEYYWLFNLPDNVSLQYNYNNNCCSCTTGKRLLIKEENEQQYQQYDYIENDVDTCPNTKTVVVFIWKILRFTKHIIIKIGQRSVTIIPIVVWCTTILVSFVIGLLIGSRKSTNSCRKLTSTTSSSSSSSLRQQHEQKTTNPITRIQLMVLSNSVLSYLFQCMVAIHHRMVGSTLLSSSSLSSSSETRMSSNGTGSFSSKALMKENVQNNSESQYQYTSSEYRIDTETKQQPATTLNSSLPFRGTNNGTEEINDTCADTTETGNRIVDLDQEENARRNLKYDNEQCTDGSINRDLLYESYDIDSTNLPKHIAVIMDGNRRYGQQYYNNPSLGHWYGTKKLLQFIKWCIYERIQIVTVYALSTENWNRSTNEITTLLALIEQHCEELRIDAIERNINVRILSTDMSLIPYHIQQCLNKLQTDTQHCSGGLQLNICLSYSGRNEILNACQNIVNNTIQSYHKDNNNNNNNSNNDNVDADDVDTIERSCTTCELNGNTSIPQEQQQSKPNNNDKTITITEEMFEQNLLTNHCIPYSNPDILIRTSGEIRISNFLLWQLAYSELFFIDKNWPEVDKDDFLNILYQYSNNRHRRYGK